MAPIFRGRDKTTNGKSSLTQKYRNYRMAKRITLKIHNSEEKQKKEKQKMNRKIENVILHTQVLGDTRYLIRVLIQNLFIGIVQRGNRIFMEENTQHYEHYHIGVCTDRHVHSIIQYEILYYVFLV